MLIGIALAIILLGIDILGTLGTASHYAGLGVPFSPTIRIVTAGGWLVILAYLLVDLIGRRRWAFRWVAPLLTLFGLSNLLWQIAFARSDYDRGRIGFTALFTVILLLPLWWTAFRRRFG